MSDVQQQKTHLDIDLPVVTGSEIILHYNTPSGNAPSTMGDAAFLWQTTSETIPQGVKANGTAGPKNDDPDNNVQFPANLDSESYLVGYAVGPCSKSGYLYENVGATIQVPQGSDTDPSKVHAPHVTDVDVTYAQDDVIAFKWTVPPGAQPGTDGDWTGVWQTEDSSDLYTQAPVATQQVTENGSSGTLSFGDVQLRRGYAYTVGYFRGGWDAKKPTQTTLAAASAFTIPD
ncbi:MAG: hypothetical protein QOF55_647 [Thermoleophilaceae bacterium]|nr:hypothetical protein [Thermoleophilaceae bacterium]